MPASITQNTIATTRSRILILIDGLSDPDCRATGGPRASLGTRPIDLASHYKQVLDVPQRLSISARIEGVTDHTLRHPFSSVAGDMGYSELTIAAFLGHGKRGVTHGYIHIEEGLREAADDSSAAKIADLLDGRASSVRRSRKLDVDQSLAA